jgi:hypothetical protein
MLKSYWLSAPFLIQMLCMAADELCFHRKRGLPRWERLGHPLDTLTVVLCLLWIILVQPSRLTTLVFLALAVFSSVFVTKDEPVHRLYCTAAEQWLHAILFLLHPLILGSAALMWPAVAGSPHTVLSLAVRYSGFERAFIIAACTLMIGFGIYQFIYWNLLWRPNVTSQAAQ